MEQARSGECIPAFEHLARIEHTTSDTIRDGVAAGVITLCNSKVRSIDSVAIGKGLRIKVNANIGTSSDASSIEEEVDKALCAIEYGADMIMDLSTGGDIPATRKRILAEISVPVGTVPIYEAGVWAAKNRRGMVRMPDDDERLALKDSWTVEGWASLSDPAAGGVVVSRTVGGAVNYELGIEPGGQPYVRTGGMFEGSNYAHSAMDPVPLGRGDWWYHLAGVYDGADLRF